MNRSRFDSQWRLLSCPASTDIETRLTNPWIPLSPSAPAGVVLVPAIEAAAAVRDGRANGVLKLAFGQGHADAGGSGLVIRAAIDQRLGTARSEPDRPYAEATFNF